MGAHAPFEARGATAVAIADGVRAGRWRARDVVEAYLDRIARVDPALGCYLRVDADGARRRADAVDATRAAGRDPGLLAGVPLGIKDLFCTKGVETTCASKILRGFIPPYESTATERLATAGGVMLGKLNMDEFAMGSSNENSGFHPVRNPWAITHVPGGSSGGSAAAVAASLCAGATGTDTGGSIRQPASLCGVVGIKPTYGRISRYGIVAFASSLDHPGSFGRTVEDAAALLEVMAGPDPRDATSIPQPVGAYRQAARAGREGLAGVRIGVPAEYFQPGMDAEVEASVRAALDELARAGAKLVDVSLPHTKYAIATYYLICTAEASSNLARYDGVKYGHRTSEARSLEDLYTKTRGEGFGAEPKRRIMLGAYVLRAGYYEAYYGKALRARRRIADDFSAAFAGCDAIVTPTSPVPAFRFGERMGDPLQMYLADVLTVAADLAGIPALSQPCGFTKAGLPIGLQVIGPALGEEILPPRGGGLRGAHRLDSAAPPRGFGSGRRRGVSDLGKYELVVGLEVHAQLATRSKIFSWSSAAFGAEPNTATDPVCLGLPGTLPVLNRAAVDAAVRLGLAVGSRIRRRCRFSRKHYFYPDLPKGFQISQFDEPICEGGTVRFRLGGELRSVRLVRIHMEEDAGKNIHATAGSSFVDYNRAGVPLCEIVSEPDVRSAEEASEYMRAIRTLVRYLGIGDGNMDEGSLRCDANVSLRLRGATAFGTKTEIKNMNSFKNVRDAIEHEAKRQAAVLDRGERVLQETRLWDPGAA